MTVTVRVRRVRVTVRVIARRREAGHATRTHWHAAAAALRVRVRLQCQWYPAMAAGGPLGRERERDAALGGFTAREAQTVTGSASEMNDFRTHGGGNAASMPLAVPPALASSI